MPSTRDDLDAKQTVTYLGPAVRLSPGQDANGQPEPFVPVGGKIELSERQIRALESSGHQFKGRQPSPGDAVAGAVQYQPGAPVRPSADQIPPSPETVPPPTGSVGTAGGQLPPTAEQQQAAAEQFPTMDTADQSQQEGKKK